MSEPKPCPFCGGTAVEAMWSPLDIGTEAHVHCYRCGTNGPSVYREGLRCAQLACDAARGEWNKREQK
jgi:hypothetical protein